METQYQSKWYRLLRWMLILVLLASVTQAASAAASKPVSSTSGSVIGYWASLPEGLSAREGHTAVWAFDEMIVWGGIGSGVAYNTGGRYSASTESWVATTTAGAPESRAYHTAVWTGSQMIVWGGQNYFGSGMLNTGGVYNPFQDSWTATATTGAPDARRNHTAVWTGTEMLVWGGETILDFSDVALNTGARYNPNTNSWTPMSTTGAPQGRYGYSAVWTGTELIIWGGYTGYFDYHNTGARYNPATNTWTPITTTGAPVARARQSAVWSGTEMLVWGGEQYHTNTHYNTGARYNPAADTWTPITTTGAPDARSHHTAVWTGSRMIIWGGYQERTNPYNTGGLYDPSADAWTSMSAASAPEGRYAHTAVWGEKGMFIFGGDNGDEIGFLGSGGRFVPAVDPADAAGIWLPTPRGQPPRELHTAVWTGSGAGGTGEMIIWGGECYGPCDTYYNTGARYKPATNTWTATTTVNAPAGRYSHTAVWTGTGAGGTGEMLVWGGWVKSGGVVNTGGRYNPVTDTWSPISTNGAPEARAGHVAVWTGTEMIVWGGYKYENANTPPINTGGRYNPVMDTWAPMSTDGAPEGRDYVPAVWTGTGAAGTGEMLIWGGVNYDTRTFFNTGARYNPATNTWAPISTAGALEARSDHSAVWTGTDMLVWGGRQYDFVTFTNTCYNNGARYNPATNTWTALSTVNAPDARLNHSAVWTGSRMIVWGGYEERTKSYNTGGIYDPASGVWKTMSIINAPEGRYRQTAVWAGGPTTGQLIVWGGDNADELGYLSTGGRYFLNPYIAYLPSITR